MKLGGSVEMMLPGESRESVILPGGGIGGAPQDTFRGREGGTKTIATSKFSTAWLVLVVAIVLMAALALAACGGAGPAAGPDAGSYQGTRLEGPAPDFRLVSQRGVTVALSDLRGSVVVLAFLDPHCTDVCPATALHFRLARESLGDEAELVTFVAVNVNPEASEVADVAAASEKWAMSTVPNWHFLTGNLEALQEVWQAYDILAGGEKPGKAGEVEHTPGVFIIDREGQRQWYISTAFDAGLPLGKLLAGHIRGLLQ